MCANRSAFLPQPGFADRLAHHRHTVTTAPSITPRDCRASLGPVKPLRFAPTPFGAGGLDGSSGPPRIRTYVMAGMHPWTSASTTPRKVFVPDAPFLGGVQHQGTPKRSWMNVLE